MVEHIKEPGFQLAASQFAKITDLFISSVEKLPLDRIAGLHQEAPPTYVYSGLTLSILEDLMYPGEWLEERVIDYFILTSSENTSTAGIEYLPFQSRFMELLRPWNENGDEEDVDVKLNRVILDAMTNGDTADMNVRSRVSLQYIYRPSLAPLSSIL